MCVLFICLCVCVCVCVRRVCVCVVCVSCVCSCVCVCVRACVPDLLGGGVAHLARVEGVHQLHVPLAGAVQGANVLVEAPERVPVHLARGGWWVRGVP